LIRLQGRGGGSIEVRDGPLGSLAGRRRGVLLEAQVPITSELVSTERTKATAASEITTNAINANTREIPRCTRWRALQAALMIA
jgi:hypothetical protein